MSIALLFSVFVFLNFFCQIFLVANEKTDGSGSAEQEPENHDWEKELHDELQVCIV